MSVLLIGSCFLAGCASYSIKPVPASELSANGWGTDTGNHTNGYIIGQPELYFKTTTSVDSAKKTTTITFEPFYVPNYSKPYRITTSNFLAKADFSFTFADGVTLTAISDKSDNSTIANTLAGTASTMMKTMMMAAISSKSTPKAVTLPETVAFYRPVYDSDGMIESLKAVNLLP